MLAHELRNPLGAIRNAAEILARTIAADSETYRSSNMIRRRPTSSLAWWTTCWMYRASRRPHRAEKGNAQRRHVDRSGVRDGGTCFRINASRCRCASFEPLHVIGDVTRLCKAL